jgi:hypothetical protein
MSVPRSVVYINCHFQGTGSNAVESFAQDKKISVTSAQLTTGGDETRGGMVPLKLVLGYDGCENESRLKTWLLLELDNDETSCFLMTIFQRRATSVWNDERQLVVDQFWGLPVVSVKSPFLYFQQLGVL